MSSLAGLPTDLAAFDASLDVCAPVFERVTRLAAALFGAQAAITLASDDGIRKFGDAAVRRRGAGMRLVVATGDLLWVEDASLHPLLKASPEVEGEARVRFCVGAPIRLADDSIPGVLWVSGPEPRPHDPQMAERLRDLAEILADEWKSVKAQAALKASIREREHAYRTLTAIVESAPLSVAMTDCDLQVIAASPQWMATRSQKLNEALGASLRDMGPDLFDEWLPIFRRGLAGEPYRADRVRLKDRRGAIRWVQVEVTPWRDATGEVGGLILTSHDVTDLVEAKDEAEAATRAKSAFLATMSHEIRTPLNGVLGMAQAMAMGDLSSPQRDRLDVIRQSGESLLAILNDVLDLSKIEAGKLELERADFDLGELVRGVRATFAATAEMKGLSLEVAIDRSVEGLWEGDAVRVRQILNNLVSNALKFTDAGGVKVSARRRDGRVRISVRDTGIGVAPEAVARLFEKFEQADASTTRQYGGTGLGLAICRDLADLMDGRIWARSKPGAGSTFFVDLPLTRSRRPAPGGRARQSAKAAPGGVLPLRVLAAEDNAMNQLVLRTLLNQIGVDPVMVSDGEAAVAAWSEHAWDLILMDVQMPRMDGPTATRRIRDLEATRGLERTPIVALTANAMEHQVAEYLKSGMDGFVAKPIQASRLFSAVQAALDKAEARRIEAAA